MSKVILGSVKYVNAEKGFAFITVEDREKDVFLHATQLKDFDFAHLKAGQTVEIGSIKETKQGEQAQDVRVS